MANRSILAKSMTRDRIIAAQLAARNRVLQAQLDVILHSRSWKLTKPLREIMAWAQRRDSRDTWKPAPLVEAEPGKPLPLDDVWSDCDGKLVETRWLIDVTDLSLHAFHAGVQRVSFQLLCAWLLDPPPGIRVEPVRLAAGGVYCHARRYLAALVGESRDQFGADALVEPRSSDRFLGLDLLRDYADDYRDGLRHLKDMGVDLSIIVHDVLPLSNPEWFPSGVTPRFKRWLEATSEVADRFLCISECTRTATTTALTDLGLPTPRDGLHVIPLGADFQNWPIDELVVNRNRENFGVLSVGTVEARKGYSDVLDAMEHLWSKGINVEWTIVGAPGWGVESLIERLSRHPELGARLRWHQNADDALLLTQYRQHDLLVNASYGEGYGLPIAEAGKEGLSLLLRDIPVFQEIAGATAVYFAGSTGILLSEALEAIIRRDRSSSRQSNWSTWTESARFIHSVLAASTSVGDCNES